MKCPRDGTDLTAIKVGEIEIDKCHHCDGLWFDRGELKQIEKINRSGASNPLEQEIEQQFGNPVVEPGSTQGYMRCPRCAEARLQQVTYTFAKQVKVDRCENCLGLWLDRSELDAILGGKKTVGRNRQKLSSLRFLAIHRPSVRW